ncbi:D-alanyl-D-alanine carboxypeptidase/D-alanyl-D-alanine-endopeptidase [Donghicola sp. C2-DW-16]|uniref:D-alanyl-D-alanine carboxypeptidase/D-alanyl-D-alanine-endopeptidase n=1 Tax=Donghicola mangrovi TaxID=2729614 RepID=A0ABX2PF60_9RHOB|nr:D-alanyl-D-alanine carboxypeptidase/D-alanyl-D-alanine-endopeptidase [Donghicola mangrovi]NVO28105.1 D-alanyl-D-alanine carboxypeptidase/D-alanyl-D-alanine-endopeptidase [Donghicola mangrovi]
MVHAVSRRFFVGALGATALQVATADAAGLAQSLRPQLRPGAGAASGGTKVVMPAADSLLANAGLSGQVIYAVADARTGQVLEAREVAGGLPPASVAKSVTAVYALETLGPAYRFHTRIIAVGSVSGGVVNGDLVLAGGGDPTLDTDGMADLAKQLKAAGIREVRGKFLVYGGALPFTVEIDKDQPDYAGYNPPISGLNLNYNRVHFEWKRAAKGFAMTMDARSDHYRPDVTMAKISIAQRDLPVFTYKDLGAADSWTVASGALGNGGARWLPVRKPELYAGEVLQVFARSHGINLPKPQVTRSAPRGSVLAQRSSAPLQDVLKSCLKYSTNLTAEIAGLTASIKRAGQVSSLRASGQLMTAWAESRLGMKGCKFVDHSGLGAESRVTAAGLAQAYTGAVHRGLLPHLMKSIPMTDPKGKAIPTSQLNVHAKTGTLNFASGLGGYITTAKGRDLTFAIFAADLPKRATLTEFQKESPPGGKTWNRRAKALQQALIQRWGAVYDA